MRLIHHFVNASLFKFFPRNDFAIKCIQTMDNILMTIMMILSHFPHMWTQSTLHGGKRLIVAWQQCVHAHIYFKIHMYVVHIACAMCICVKRVICAYNVISNKTFSTPTQLNLPECCGWICIVTVSIQHHQQF